MANLKERLDPNMGEMAFAFGFDEWFASLKENFNEYMAEPVNVDASDIDSVLAAVLSFTHLSPKELAWYGRQISRRFGWPIELVRTTFTEAGLYDKG